MKKQKRKNMIKLNTPDLSECNCKTCKRVKAMIKHIQEMKFESITMNKDRYLEDFTDLLK